MLNARSNDTEYSDNREYNDNRADHPTSSIVGGNQINITGSNVTLFALTPDFIRLLIITLSMIIASVVVLLIIAMGDAFK
jgi:hypothetical protein